MSRTREKALNDAIARAHPNAGFEPFACAYIEFYHSDARVKIENRELQGQEDVFSALMSLLTLLDLGVGSALKRLTIQQMVGKDGWRRRGILSGHPKKFSVTMVKLKSFRINEQFLEKPFSHCHWEI